MLQSNTITGLVHVCAAAPSPVDQISGLNVTKRNRCFPLYLTQCANSTWDLYAWNDPDSDQYEYFCCLTGLQGIYSKEKSTYGFFGCLNQTDVDDDTMGMLDIASTGTGKSTGDSPR